MAYWINASCPKVKIQTNKFTKYFDILKVRNLYCMCVRRHENNIFIFNASFSGTYHTSFLKHLLARQWEVSFYVAGGLRTCQFGEAILLRSLGLLALIQYLNDWSLKTINEERKHAGVVRVHNLVLFQLCFVCFIM